MSKTDVAVKVNILSHMYSLYLQLQLLYRGNMMQITQACDQVHLHHIGYPQWGHAMPNCIPDVEPSLHQPSGLTSDTGVAIQLADFTLLSC